jgi:hypothetical protein
VDSVAEEVGEFDTLDDPASNVSPRDAAKRNRDVWASARLWDELLQHACAQPDNLAGALKVCVLTAQFHRFFSYFSFGFFSDFYVFVFR